MRKFKIGIFIVLIIILTGCGNNANTSGEIELSQIEETNDSDTVHLKPCTTYQDILDNAYEVIITDNGTDIVLSDELFSYDGIREAKMGRDTEEALAGIGYTYYDVDDNGIEELIIADTGPEGWNNRILLMYTLYDDKPVLLIDGWARNRYYLLNDGTIYNEGSSGAAYTSFGVYRIAEDGSQIIELEDVPANMMEDYMAQVKELELTFFEELKETTLEQTARAAYFDFLSGDVSLVENKEVGQSWVDFYLPNSELEYAFLDLDGDDVSELLIQWIDTPEGFNAVFHYSDGTLFCWNFDSVEMSSRNYPLQNGTMVHQYDYSGTSSWTAVSNLIN